MRRRLTLGLTTLLTFIALGGAAQAQLPIRIIDRNTGATIQTTPWGTPYQYNYSYPTSSYQYYETTTPSYYYNRYPSSSYYYNYDYNPRTARNSYYRHSRGFPAAHERQNYYYDNNGYYIRYR